MSVCGGHSPIHTHTHTHQKSCSYFVGVYFFSFLVFMLSLSFKFIEKSDSLLSASLSHTFKLTHSEIWNNSPCHCVHLSVYLSPICSFTHTHTHYVSACSLRMYSPMSAWWNTTGVMGSVCRQPSVDLAATPKPCSTNITSSLDGEHVQQHTVIPTSYVLDNGQFFREGVPWLTGGWWNTEYR